MKAKRFRRLASVDTSAWAFIRGVCAYVVSTESSCDGTYKFYNISDIPSLDKSPMVALVKEK